MMKRSILIYVVTVVFVFVSCSDDDMSNNDIVDEAFSDEQPINEEESEEDDMSTDLLAFQELYDQGIDQYLGTISPISSEPVDGGAVEHKFNSEDGPVCFTGNQFSMFTRDGSSNNLLIFLQGGGLCNPFSCEAVEEGIPLVNFGILSSQDPQNPVENWNLGYLPYCDGSIWMGDNEVDSDDDGVNDRFFKGIQNLSASLDVIAQQYQSPDKILLAGNSAGGFGVHAALPLVRKLYPDVAIEMINDSGMGITQPGFHNLNFNYWNANVFIPNSCSNCIGEDGNLTEWHRYQLNEDQNMRMAYISSKQDELYSALLGPEVFEAELIDAANSLNQSFPSRFNSLIINGMDHTFLISDFIFPVGGTTINQWVEDMVNENESWDSVID